MTKGETFVHVFDLESLSINGDIDPRTNSKGQVYVGIPTIVVVRRVFSISKVIVCQTKDHLSCEFFFFFLISALLWANQPSTFSIITFFTFTSGYLVQPSYCCTWILVDRSPTIHFPCLFRNILQIHAIYWTSYEPTNERRLILGHFERNPESIGLLGAWVSINYKHDDKKAISVIFANFQLLSNFCRASNFLESLFLGNLHILTT